MIPSRPSPARLVSFDTTGSSLSLCFFEDGVARLAEAVEPDCGGRQQAATMLMPRIDRALRSLAWEKDTISALVVGQGPGSFTGIRIGLVTARTLAHALNLPLLGVSQFECYASLVERPAGVILYCGPDTYFASSWQDGPDSWLVPVLKPSYLFESDLLAALPTIRCWLVDDQSRASLESKVDAGDWQCFKPLPAMMNIAETQAQIAWNRLSLRLPASRNGADIKGLAGQYHWNLTEPLYLRGPSVTIKKNARPSDKTDDTK